MLNLPTPNKQLRKEVKFYERLGKWAVRMDVRGPQHAAHLHVFCYDSSGSDGWGGGLEMHWAAPPEHRQNEAPDYLDCPMTGGRCWHGGTSSGAKAAIEYVRGGQYGRAMDELVQFYTHSVDDYIEPIWMYWADVKRRCEENKTDIDELVSLLSPKNYEQYMLGRPRVT